MAGVIGSPIRHSLSPVIVNAAFDALELDWSYFAFEVAPGDVEAALDGMRALGLAGLSVTMPHKERAAALVDRCSVDATALGAVNCIVRDSSELVGENTDGPGFIDALAADTGFDPAGRRAVVLGAGGAARAVVLALARAGWRDRHRGSEPDRRRMPNEPSPSRPASAARQRRPTRCRRADLVVNATPVGMTDRRPPP